MARATPSRSKNGRLTPADPWARTSATRSGSRPKRSTVHFFKSQLRRARPSCKNGYFEFPKCRAGTAVLWKRPPALRLVAMSFVRFTSSIVYFAAVAVLAPVVLTGCDHPAQFAADAHADTLPPPAQGQVSGDRQFSAMPSLAPIVKQLRPTVVNVASRFKPRRVARNQRPPQGRQQRPNPFDNSPGDDDENGQGGQEDPMERFFRFFGGGPQGQGPDQQERHGLGSGFLIGDGLVLTNNHVVEIQDEGRGGKFRAMDEIKVITDESAPGGAREFSAKVIGNDPKSDIAILKIEGKDVGSLKYASLGDSDALEVGDY